MLLESHKKWEVSDYIEESKGYKKIVSPASGLGRIRRPDGFVSGVLMLFDAKTQWRLWRRTPTNPSNSMPSTLSRQNTGMCTMQI
jgi:hypothetical protein